MKDVKPIIVGLVAVVIALLAFMVWQLRRRQEPVTPAPAQAAAPPNLPAPQARPAAIGAPAAPTAPAEPVPVPSAGGIPAPAEIGDAIAIAHAHLQSAARPCVIEAKPPIEQTRDQLRIRYSLAIEGGQSRARDVEVLGSDFHDDKLRDCILAKIRAARWPSRDVQLAAPVVEDFRVQDLGR